MTGGQEEGAPLTVYLSDSITLCVCVCRVYVVFLCISHVRYHQHVVVRLSW